MLRSSFTRRALISNIAYSSQRKITMATAHTILLDPQHTGLWKVKQTDESAKKASELLQRDLENHHVFFNRGGFHNHIAHHILSLFGTGANPTIIQRGYDQNASYQRPALPKQEEVVQDLFQTWDHAQAYLGKEKHYPNFLAFFQREIDAKGWEAVLSEYLFAGTPSADDLLVRLYAGFLHPLIQLMYGVEWGQPALCAEGLAQTCVHQADYKDILLTAEKKANMAYGSSQQQERIPSILSLLEEIHNDPKLSTAVSTNPGLLSNKVRDGVLVNAPEEMLRVISKVKVRPEELHERTAEMFDAAIYAAASASFQGRRLGKYTKFDFFLIHHVNSVPFILSINNLPSISLEAKVRLLEWKIRYDLIQYAARGVPALSLDDIRNYQPKKAGGASVLDVVSRLHNFSQDDGHAIKLGRAAAICHELSKKYEDRDWIIIKGDDTWMKIHHLIVDSVEAPGPAWVRTTGVDEAWDDVPSRSNL